MIKDVRKYVYKYDIYQRIKNCIEAPIGKLIANKVLERLSENIGNTVSLDPLYRGLVTLLDWSLPKLASNRLITTSILF